MKTLTRKILSFILTLSMLFSLAVPVFAAESGGSSGTSADTQEEMDAAREAYAALTPEAKAIFEASLAYDSEMLKFHTTYVDESFTPPAPVPQARAAAADPMRVLMAELSGLGLPSAVLYSLKAMGAGMVASIADGPLPVGEILLAAATASTAVVIAAHWKTVSPKFNQIVRAFQRAFSTAASNISSVFAKMKSEAQKEADKKEKEKVKQKNYSRAKRDGKPTDNHSTETGTRLSPKGSPYSSKDLKDSKGVKQRRYYDKNGNADMDIDYRHGGNETHKFPHRHEWHNGVRGKAY